MTCTCLWVNTADGIVCIQSRDNNCPIHGDNAANERMEKHT